jgi:tRNA (guanine37-N1)-methyltransferase
MRIDIISCVPRLLDSFFEYSILQRAQKSGTIDVKVHDLRDYGSGKHKQTDDYAFGGGAGMVMMIEPIDHCISALRAERNYDAIIYTSPDGEPFGQAAANRLSMMQNIIILCGHYKGVDERVRQHLITHEFSIGDFVLSGGELPAAVMADAILRLVPGVMNDETSALTDSFQDGLIAPPVYTRPANYQGWEVPGILLSGHQARIDEWRMEQSVLRTKERRPELIHQLSENQLITK